MLKVAVCDDSTITLEQMEQYFEALQSIQLTYEIFHGANDLLHYMSVNIDSFDVYILDIEMMDMNGILLAKRIRSFDLSALIIFQTVHPAYVYDVFDIVTFHFLKKSILFEKLEEVLQRAEVYINRKKCRFHFNFAKENYTISCRDILYFEQNRRKVNIYTKVGAFESYMTNKEVMRQLKSTEFVKLGVSYIVNLEYVKVIARDVVILNNEKYLPISRKNRKTVKEKQLEYQMKRI